ncbi:MAG: riboflavin biosynthesis protein RibF [Deltaproteobacteria bacterium]|jgi:riboflavin kinase/FMN adenylyltransferase|nr:riboflavin biosynthesis protein RibF [Deltaproteobacteria bacterium]
MIVVQDWLRDAPVPGLRAVLTIGVFDGLHRGHRYLLERVIAGAAALGVDSLLLTFEPHPLSVLSSKYAPEILTTFPQKAGLLSDMGLSILACLRFDQEMASLGAEGFLDGVIASRVAPAGILIGPDFHFGRNAEGDFALLESWARGRGIPIEAVEMQRAPGGEVFSSSHVRGLLKTGHVESAARLLGRPYRISGVVIEGQRRGRELGFPTANLGKVSQLIPGPGVYAAMAVLDGKRLFAMTSVGNNPTFKGQSLTVETNILDFKGDLYGRDMGLDFIGRIRGMVRFDSATALAERLGEDERQARAILSAGLELGEGG